MCCLPLRSRSTCSRGLASAFFWLRCSPLLSSAEFRPASLLLSSVRKDVRGLYAWVSRGEGSTQRRAHPTQASPHTNAVGILLEYVRLRANLYTSERKKSLDQAEYVLISTYIPSLSCFLLVPSTIYENRMWRWTKFLLHHYRRSYNSKEK